LLGGLLWTPPATTADEPPVLALDGHTERAPSSEERLVRSLLGVENGHLEEALRQATGLVEDQPDFKLGQMVYGDVLAALSGRLPRFAYAAPRGVAGGMRSEARARLQGYLQAPPAGAVPDELLQLPADVEQVILVDLEAFRLYVVAHEKGGLRIVGDYYASIGKGGIDKQREGDEKTPVGVYTVTGYLPDERLLDLYGIGAFPISYPNRWDIFRGRTGSGIWIHGTEWTTYSRPPLSSRGCVTLSNEHFEDLRRRVEVGKTPVIVAREFRWVPPREVENRRRDLLAAVEQWRQDWESLDTDRYLSHYAEDFRTDDMEREEFAAHKHRVNSEKRFIRVELGAMGAYEYPGEDNLFMVEFRQVYDSSNFSSLDSKQQFWRRQADGWRIVHEGDVDTQLD
jgi:murein L,D-transpeptidase YafK